MKILIFGLPGSGKTTLAKPLAELIGGVHLNADNIREMYEGHDKKKWDFSPEGRIRQAQRMRYLADGIVLAGKVVVADFVCPTKETREIFKADFKVYMDTIKSSKYEDTNSIFEKAETQGLDCDYHVAEWFDDTHKTLIPVIDRYFKKQNTTPIGYWSYILDKKGEL